MVTCDVCKKPLGPNRSVLRYRTNWPDRLVTSVMQLHKACDNNKWPSPGYGHIEPAALNASSTAELIERSQGAATHAKIQTLFDRYGYKGPPPPAEYAELLYPLFPADYDDELPF